MSLMHIKKGDTVEILAGKDGKRPGRAAKRGAVSRVDAEKNRVWVEKINLVKRHQRPTQTSPGGIIEKEAPLDISNVMLVCPSCHQRTRKSAKTLANGKRVRVCKKCNADIDG